MFTWKRVLYASVLSGILFFGFVSLILPGIVIDRAQSWIADETGRTLHVGSVSINLIGLTVAVRDLSLSETDRDTPFIAWQALNVSLSLRSLFHLAPIVELSIEDLARHDPIFLRSEHRSGPVPHQVPEILHFLRWLLAREHPSFVVGVL